MNRKIWQWIGIFIILLGMTSLACSAFAGGDEPPTASPTTAANESAPEEAGSAEDSKPDPTETPEATDVTDVPDPTETPPEESGDENAGTSETDTGEETAGADTETTETQAKSLTVSSITQPEDVNSYRMVMDAEMISADEQGAEVVEAFQFDVAFSNDPEAMSMNLSIEGIEEAEEFGEIEMAQVEGVTYMVIPGFGCVTSTEAENFGENDPFAELTDISTFMNDIGEAQYEGEEVINDINTLHYSFDETSFVDTGEEIEWAEGDVYVAKEGGWLVRMTMEGEGVFDELADEAQFGTLKLQIDIMDINQTFDFIIPADCEGEGAGGTDFPIVEDAYNVSSLGTLLTYKTDMPFAEVLAFNRDELAAAGWEESPEESFTADDVALITFYRGAEILNLSIVKEDEEGDTLSILIVSE